MAQAEPEVALAEVNVDCAWPAVIVRVGGGAMLPWTAVNVTGVSGTVPPAEVSAAAELNRISAVIVDVSPGPIELGEALTPSTSHGLKSTRPVTESHPPLPGPALQPHQLFSALSVTGPFQTTPVVLPTMLLTCISVPVAECVLTISPK